MTSMQISACGDGRGFPIKPLLLYALNALVNHLDSRRSYGPLSMLRIQPSQHFGDSKNVFKSTL